MNLEPPRHGNDHQKKLVKMREVRWTGGVTLYHAGTEESKTCRGVSIITLYHPLLFSSSFNGITRLVGFATLLLQRHHVNRPRFGAVVNIGTVCCYTILVVMCPYSFTIEI